MIATLLIIRALLPNILISIILINIIIPYKTTIFNSYPKIIKVINKFFKL